MKRARTLEEYLIDPATTLPRKIGAKRTIKQILERFESSGGATFSLCFGELAGEAYYAVSLYPRRTRLALDPRSLRTVLTQFISENSDLLADPRNCIGMWHDVEADVIYVDVSAVIPDRSLAERLGRAYNQMVIYDLRADESILTGGTGGEGDGWPAESERLPPINRR